MARKILLLIIAVQGAFMALWLGLRGTRPNWLVICLWVAFITGAAVLSHNWRREEREDVRGFEVLPHEKK